MKYKAKHAKRISPKVHGRILKTITTIMGIIFMVSICSVDSESYVPFIALLLSGTWLAFMAWANGWMYTKGGDEL